MCIYVWHMCTYEAHTLIVLCALFSLWGVYILYGNGQSTHFILHVAHVPLHTNQDTGTLKLRVDQCALEVQYTSVCLALHRDTLSKHLGSYDLVNSVWAVRYSLTRLMYSCFYSMHNVIITGTVTSSNSTCHFQFTTDGTKPFRVWSVRYENA